MQEMVEYIPETEGSKTRQKGHKNKKGTQKQEIALLSNAILLDSDVNTKAVKNR